MSSEKNHPAERLGQVSTPSGKLIVIDPGLMNLWSHDRLVGVQPSRLIDEKICEIANSAVDFAIRGPDAERAGKAFKHQWHLKFIYDIPVKRNEDIISAFEMRILQNRLQAELVALSERVRHRDRIDRTFEQCASGGVVQYHGVNAIVASGLPTDRKLKVLGHRMVSRPDADRWRDVCVEIANGETASEELLGRVGVDEAKILLSDINALGGWQHTLSCDGRADYIFWGRDAAIVAGEVNAPRVSGSEWGWIDGPIEEISALAEPIEKIHERREMKFATDFRPHTDFYRLLEQVRSTPTESGTIHVGGADLCGLATSWGDGHFPIYIDRSANGELLRLRIDFGNEQTVANMRAMENRQPR